jgi:hypothetical protein
MKITKKQLKQIIKEELTNESYGVFNPRNDSYDAQSEIYDITQKLSDSSMKLGEFSDFLRASDERRAGQFDSLSRQVAKINKSVETHIPAFEGGLRENANAEPPRELVRQWEKSITEFIDKQFQLGGDDIAGESPAIVAALENVRRNYSGNNKDFRE